MKPLGQHLYQKHPLCLRLPTDLHTAVVQIAARDGLSISEWVRTLIYRHIYNDSPTADDGYMQGRVLGYQAAMQTLRHAFESIPMSIDDAMPLIQAGMRRPG